MIDQKTIDEVYELTHRGLSQREIVEKVNVSRYGVAAIQKGETALQRKQLVERKKAADIPFESQYVPRYKCKGCGLMMEKSPCLKCYLQRLNTSAAKV